MSPSEWNTAPLMLMLLEGRDSSCGNRCPAPLVVFLEALRGLGLLALAPELVRGSSSSLSEYSAARSVASMSEVKEPVGAGSNSKDSTFPWGEAPPFFGDPGAPLRADKCPPVLCRIGRRGVEALLGVEGRGTRWPSE
mmetsp:Transcript_299/g.604  ORF Transcript_299/g.604 Transcript_299/m.604 type:complete len:138 (+) Transcript_299:169-582(+)